MISTPPVPVTSPPALPELPDDLGPAMRALPNERQRLFVWHYLHNGGNATRAAEAAGYAGPVEAWRVAGHRLAHTQAILEAINESCWRVLHAGTPLAIEALLEIIKDRGNKDRARAIDMLLSRTGFLALTEHKVTVTRTPSDEKRIIRNVIKLAKEIGASPRQLLGDMVDTPEAREAIDAEYAEVTPLNTAGLEDIL